MLILLLAEQDHGGLHGNCQAILEWPCGTLEPRPVINWLLASRWRVALLTLTLLGLLDIGRSVYAHVGYARPIQLWQPDPAVYADLVWPPGSDLPPSAPLGRRVYAQRCAVCHGPDGRGNGPAAPSLIPRPRDFTKGEFKYKSTPAGQPPTDDDLVRVVYDGLQASAMPAWGDLLSVPEIRAVVDYVKDFSPVFKRPPPKPLSIPRRIVSDRASLARGQQVYQRLCASCHGADGRAQVEMKDTKGYPVIVRDLTAPWTFRGGSLPEQLWLRLTTGLAPGPMPSFAGTTTPGERWDLVNYIVSLARTPPWTAGGRLEGPGQQTDLTRRGRYLVNAMMCGLCHTPINHTGIYRGDDFYLAGGMRVGTYPHGVYISRNLTSDPETGLGRWTEEQIVEAMRTGRARHRVLNFWDMPWPWLHSLQPDDARAIARYLRAALPPVRNRIPEPLRYGVLETIAVKLTREFPAINPGALTFADGMFGQTAPGFSRDLPQRIMVLLQWIVLAAGLITSFWARPGVRVRPRRTRILRGAGIFGFFVVVLIGWMLYELPFLPIIPVKQIVAGATGGGPPRPNASAFPSDEQATLAERGRYLYAVSSCALCHGGDGAGGLKISWKPMGTLWVRNITPDPNTGIGRWTDQQIARAIRSGVSADGRALHWQGMIWDHASNWDEEDVRALIIFLRTLPPVRRQIPAPRPPASDDCDVYTFWTVPSQTSGCR